MADQPICEPLVADDGVWGAVGVRGRTSRKSSRAIARALRVCSHRVAFELADGLGALRPDDLAIQKARCRGYLAAIAAAGGAQNADETAAELVAEFGSLAAAVAAPATRQLRAASGQLGVVHALRAFQGAMEHALSINLAEAPVIADGTALISYLRAKLAVRTTESVRLIHLNTRNRLLRDELLSEGTVDQAPAYVREIIHRALELGTSAMIIAHNHPSGDPSPSKGDIELTRGIISAASPLGISLIDHIVIGRFGHASLRQLGMMPLPLRWQ